MLGSKERRLLSSLFLFGLWALLSLLVVVLNLKLSVKDGEHT